jgi:hypothetical protein
VFEEPFMALVLVVLLVIETSNIEHPTLNTQGNADPPSADV